MSPVATAREVRALAGEAGLRAIAQQYFLYFPRGACRYLGAAVELLPGKLPLGGQYAVFSERPAAVAGFAWQPRRQ
jgi:hypothetical protein